eukprot:2408579-Pyramimonas_sp.AAC.1
MLVEISVLHRSKERNAFFIALAVAFFNQASASTSIINYAPKVLPPYVVSGGGMKLGWIRP